MDYYPSIFFVLGLLLGIALGSSIAQTENPDQ